MAFIRVWDKLRNLCLDWSETQCSIVAEEKASFACASRDPMRMGGHKFQSAIRDHVYLLATGGIDSLTCISIVFHILDDRTILPSTRRAWKRTCYIVAPLLGFRARPKRWSTYFKSPITCVDGGVKKTPRLDTMILKPEFGRSA